MQLRMNFNVDTYIPGDSKVRLVCNLVEEMNLDFILSTCSRRGRKPVVDPVSILKVLMFCYSEAICFLGRRLSNEGSSMNLLFCVATADICHESGCCAANQPKIRAILL